MMEWILPLAAGFILGCLHAFDVDHLTAVTAFASRSPNVRSAARFGLYWGLGHTATLFVLGMATVVFKFAIPEAFAHAAEFVVGLLLVVIGVWTLGEVFRKKHMHIHRHEHDGVDHVHIHSHQQAESHAHQHSMFAVGATHGLAGTASVLVIIPMTVVASYWTAAAFLLLFGFGTILAMSVFALVLGSVTRTIGTRLRLPWIRGTAGVASLAVGITWIIQRW